MEQIRYTVILDITDNGCFNTGWRLKQGDGQSIVLNVKVTNNGENYEAENPPRIVFKRPDGYSVIGQTDALDDDFYTYTIVGNEIAVAGNVLMDVKFGADEDRTSTASCKFEVIPDTIGQSSGGSGVYDNTVAELVEISKANVKLAESYTKGGTGSRSGEDTDNAKYYKEQAAEIVGPLTQKVNGVIEDLTQFSNDGYLSNNIVNIHDISTQTVNGITYTPYYENGVLQYIDVNGTSTSQANYTLISSLTLKSGQYFIGGSTSKVSVWYFGVGNGAKTLASDVTNGFILFVNANTTVNHEKIYPYINKGLVDKGWTPYAPSNADLNASLTQIQTLEEINGSVVGGYSSSTLKSYANNKMIVTSFNNFTVTNNIPTWTTFANIGKPIKSESYGVLYDSVSDKALPIYISSSGALMCTKAPLANGAKLFGQLVCPLA